MGACQSVDAGRVKRNTHKRITSQESESSMGGHQNNQAKLAILKKQITKQQNREKFEKQESGGATGGEKKTTSENVIENTVHLARQESTTEELPEVHWMRGESIGKGYFGEVFQGFDYNSGQLIAIKSIPLSHFLNEEITTDNDQLVDEIISLKRLAHPNVLKYIEVDIMEDKTGLDILLEYIPAGSARTVLDKFGKIEEKIVRIYTRQILTGLEHLHRNTIIHGNLKCSNVLVDSEAVIKLSDFFLSGFLFAKLDKTKMEEKWADFHPYWVAPELLSGKNCEKSDIWSIGCVVIEMLTSQNPWGEKGELPIGDFFKLLSNPTAKPLYPPSISEECKDFLDYCFKRKLEERPKAKHLLKHPFLRDQFESVKEEQQTKYEIMKQITSLSTLSLSQLKRNPLQFGESSMLRQSHDKNCFSINSIYLSGLYNVNSIQISNGPGIMMEEIREEAKEYKNEYKHQTKNKQVSSGPSPNPPTTLGVPTDSLASIKRSAFGVDANPKVFESVVSACSEAYSSNDSGVSGISGISSSGGTSSVFDSKMDGLSEEEQRKILELELQKELELNKQLQSAKNKHI